MTSDHSRSSIWVATVTLQTSDDRFSETNPYTEKNKDRLEGLFRIVEKVSSEISGSGVVLFPGGWVHTGKKPAESIFSILEKKISSFLKNLSAHVVVSIGIDGSFDREGFDRDQISITLDKSGIISIAKKYQVKTSEEKKRVHLTTDFRFGDFGKSRIFSLNGIRFYPAICYDTYGPQQYKLENPGVDVILSHVHYFVPLTEDGPKGVVDFVRKGFVGASAQWHCPVFGAAIFIRRGIPKSWRTGMIYRSHPKPYMKSKIEENSIMPFKSFTDSNFFEGSVLVQIFDLGDLITEKGKKLNEIKL